MPIVIRSPYSGLPVKVRDQDINRAIRDEEGRIFYVVPRSSGQGYYAAPTRKGSEKDEQRYLELDAKVAALGATVKSEAMDQAAGARIHDATGRRRPNRVRQALLALLLLLAAVAVVVAIYLFGEGLTGQLPWAPTEQEQAVPEELQPTPALPPVEEPEPVGVGG